MARLRKEQDITRPKWPSGWASRNKRSTYEVGRRRIQVSMLPTVARLLGVSLEELVGETNAKPGKRGPAPKLQQLERLVTFPAPSSASSAKCWTLSSNRRAKDGG
jgi:hypothetical protein